MDAESLETQVAELFANAKNNARKLGGGSAEAASIASAQAAEKALMLLARELDRLKQQD